MLKKLQADEWSTRQLGVRRLKSKSIARASDPETAAAPGAAARFIMGSAVKSWLTTFVAASSSSSSVGAVRAPPSPLLQLLSPQHASSRHRVFRRRGGGPLHGARARRRRGQRAGHFLYAEPGSSSCTEEAAATSYVERAARPP